MNAFELRSLPDKKKRRLFLIQLPYKTSVIAEVSQPTTLSMIDGAQLEAASVLILELVADRLSSAPASGKDILDEPFQVAIDEETALRLGLLFASIGTLRSDERIQEIITGVQSLDAQEAGFWLNTITRDATGNRLKAFRVAMTGEA